MNRHNHCFVVGNLGMDPLERGRTASGIVVKLSVAENVSRYNEETRQFETVHTNWFPVTAFSPLAERVLQLRRGDKVVVQGRMKIAKFTDRAGEERTGFEILADDVALWSSLPAVAASAAPAADAEAEPAPEAAAQAPVPAPARAAGRVVKRITRPPAKEAASF
jgi:single-strand DNA-binding protein